jgi:acetate CoA/acetoacetate CoA-transferase alpha subunit
MLFPQGRWPKSSAAAGAGIAGFYTPVGVGTIVEKARKSACSTARVSAGVALRGDVALVKATVADKFGNCFMRASTKNFGALMGRAADYVIAEAQKIVEVGELDPELVSLPAYLSTPLFSLKTCER